MEDTKDPDIDCQLLEERKPFLAPQQHPVVDTIIPDRFKLISDISFDAIVIHKDRRLLHANQKLFDMFGYTFDDLCDVNGLELIAQDSRHIVMDKMTLYDTGLYEVTGLKKDGTQFPIEIHAKQTQIDGVTVRIAAIRDISERKAMERRILESEKNYRELYNRAQIPLYRTRLSDGKLIECNQAMAKLIGYDTPQECLREYHSVAHYVNPARRTELLELLNQGILVTGFEIEFIRRNGARAWVEITAQLYPEQGWIEGVQFDITALKVLSPVEKEVLLLILQGKCNKEAAKILDRSTRTIEDHRARIMQKLGATNLVELAQIGMFLKCDPRKQENQ
jgi:PAS domain S-box-containing protein